MSGDEQYDVVVVGAGVAGALMAKYLTRAGFRVLVLEAGPATAKSFDGYTEHLEHFYTATSPDRLKHIYQRGAAALRPDRPS